jgi:hypothetical protein
MNVITPVIRKANMITIKSVRCPQDTFDESVVDIAAYDVADKIT